MRRQECMNSIGLRKAYGRSVGCPEHRDRLRVLGIKGAPYLADEEAESLESPWHKTGRSSPLLHMRGELVAQTDGWWAILEDFEYGGKEEVREQAMVTK